MSDKINWKLAYDKLKERYEKKFEDQAIELEKVRSELNGFKEMIKRHG